MGGFMTYIIEYFDLNKRTNNLQKKSKQLLDQLVTSEKSEIKLEIPDVPQSQESYKSTIHGHYEADGYTDEDPLYNDMARYWETHDRRGKPDRRNADRRQHILSSKLLSILIKPRTSIPWWQQLALYSGIIFGAIISSTVIEHQAGTDYIFKISIPTVFLASALAILISPVAFEKLCMNIAGSFFTRFFLFIQNGVFWYVMLSAFSFTLTQLFSLSLG
jgi:hypothetical protein